MLNWLRAHRWVAYGAAASLVMGVSVVLLHLPLRVPAHMASPLLLLSVLLSARLLGTGPALAASGVAAVAYSYYFLPPSGFWIEDPNDWVAFITFVVTALITGELSARAERQRAEATAGRHEIERLYQELQVAFDRASEAEAARRNEELKAALLDALTHNLRTPLTSIKAAVTALLGTTGGEANGLAEESRHELLEVINEESDRLNRFIEGLSTPTSPGEHPLRVRAADLEHIVQAGVRRAEALTRDHTVVVEPAPALPLVWVDAAAVAEVLYILLDNASKYSPAGTRITVRRRLDDEGMVRVDVGDEGPGIPDDMRELVFEKFYRVPKREPRDPRRAGVGLGLPIARRLVEAQGGRLWIETPAAVGGSLFVMVLPVAASSGDRE